MNWPPNKAWTSQVNRKGYRHFVAINYGGRGVDRWVNLVSVLDGDVRLRVKWIEMTDGQLWATGWQQLPREEANQYFDNAEFGDQQLDRINDSACLHPSIDSGLLIPSDNPDIRPWCTEADSST